ncbi:MAG: SUMF1/EgtB/PvdO family nonheme iron enzyme [Pseudomonadota bacterium]
MADVFISYNREDQHRARAIADSLEAEGLSVWWDSNLRAGQSYDEVTEKNLREAGAVAVLWSSRSVNSKWVRAEATIGERDSTLVPAMIEECDRPLRFELVQTADLINWHGDRSDPNWRNFVQDIKSAIGKSAPAAAAPAPQAPNDTGAGASSDSHLTIENTFWTSIKDGGDKSDFEAYLKRYPDGHFADLARNRLTMLERSAAAAAPSIAPTQNAAPRTAQPTPQAAPPPAPKPAPAARPAQRTAAPARSAAPPAPSAPPPSKSGVSPVLLGLGGVAVLAGAGALFMLTRGGDEAPSTAAASTPPATEAAPTPQQESPAEAVIADSADTEIEGGDVSPAAAQSSADALANASSAEAAEPDAVAPDAATATEIAAKESTFRDCDVCPQMATAPRGAFMMGSPDNEPGRDPYEGPQREVTVASFAISAHEVTHAEWNACVDDGGCGGYKPGDAGFGRDDRPAIYISWRDATRYAAWLSEKTGKKYRLPSEAEWEYAARGGADTAYSWGAGFDASRVPLGKTEPVGAFEPNGFGLYDMHGNAAEWVQDCYTNNYAAAPTDGSASLSGDCERRVVRGGSWRSNAKQLRTANRSRISRDTRDRAIGFRVALDLE